jgi:DNA-binding transcriptional MocR family regulator
LSAAKMGTVISCGAIDETLATLILDHEAQVLAEQRSLLGRAVQRVANWVDQNKDRVEWVRPDAGAICSIRLRPEHFAQDQILAVYDAFKKRGVKIAPAAMFGDEERIFRLGFGCLADARLAEALEVLSEELSGWRSR